MKISNINGQSNKIMDDTKIDVKTTSNNRRGARGNPPGSLTYPWRTN